MKLDAKDFLMCHINENESCSLTCVCNITFASSMLSTTNLGLVLHNSLVLGELLLESFVVVVKLDELPEYPVLLLSLCLDLTLHLLDERLQLGVLKRRRGKVALAQLYALLSVHPPLGGEVLTQGASVCTPPRAGYVHNSCHCNNCYYVAT